MIRQKPITFVRTPTPIIQSRAIIQYVNLTLSSNKKTGLEYKSRLYLFEVFWTSNYDFTLDDLLIKRIFNVDIYEVLSKFVSFLSNKKTYTNLTIKQYVVTIRNFFEYYDYEISPRKFKHKVKIPKTIKRKKTPLTRNLIIKILESCTNFKLKMFLLCLASTGMRAGEASSIRLQDINFDDRIINIHGEHTKTKEDRYVFLTDELSQQLKLYLDYKYRKRTLYIYYNKDTKQTLKYDKPVIFTPPRRDTDLVFATTFEKDGKVRSEESYKNVYVTMVILFEKVIDRLNIPLELSGKRHIITLHSFRRYVKSVISDSGYTDYSEWLLGHTGSPYYTRSVDEQYKLFKKLEPSLTYLDQSYIQSQHADTQSRLETMEQENRGLKTKYEKDIKQLSEKLEKMDKAFRKLAG